MKAVDTGSDDGSFFYSFSLPGPLISSLYTTMSFLINQTKVTDGFSIDDRAEPGSTSSRQEPQEMPHPVLPPMSYTPYNSYGHHHHQSNHQYYPPLPPLSQIPPIPQPPHHYPPPANFSPNQHQQGSERGQHTEHLSSTGHIYAPPPPERPYYPVIDPHLEPPGTSSERFNSGPEASGSASSKESKA